MDVWTKRRTTAPAHLFAAEAAGLKWLAVPGGVDIVEVIEASTNTITLTRVHEVAPTQSAAEAFGAALAVTHDAGAAAFGAPPDGYTGPSFIADLPMPTKPATNWGTFYAEQRVMHYALLAGPELGLTGRKVIDALCQRLVAGVFNDDAPPARLHGDLWAGNVLYATTGAVLIDPSAHGGHRITDLAMLSLFGTPHLDAALNAYERASTHLPSGWRDLIGLHQVYPLLVHTVLFGGGYAAAAVNTARRYI